MCADSHVLLEKGSRAEARTRSTEQAIGCTNEIMEMFGCNKDETNYFVFFKGEESYNAWGADRKAKKMAQLTEEERILVESFCNDINGESYEYTSRLFDQIMFIAPLYYCI